MTLRKVAERAGVAIDTVRKALRDDPTIRAYLKDRVLKAAEEIDYHPNLVARALREKALRVVPISVTELENPYFGNLARHLSQELADKGLEPALCLGADHLIKMSRTLSPCGSILGYGYSEDTVQCLCKRQKVVNVGVEMRTMPGVGLVLVDFADAYLSIARALSAQRRRKVILHSSTLERYRRAGSSSNKFEATLRGLKQAGLKHVIVNGHECVDDQRMFSLPGLLVDHPQMFDTVICENDLHAAALYGAFTAKGIRVPEDVMIVGCDDNLVLPGLWTVRINTQVLAQTAVSLLLRLLDGESRLEPVIYKPVAVDDAGVPLSA